MKPVFYLSFIAPFLLLACGSVLAQNVVFTANASAPKIGLSDQLQVTYTIQDANNLQQVAPGSFHDFQVVGGPFQSQSTSIQMNGNRTVQSISISLTYVLQPRHTGNLAIPPAVAKDAAGHNYQSNALTVQVVPGSLLAAQRRQQASQDPFGDDPFGGDPFAGLRRMQGAQRQQQQAQQPASPSKPEPPADLAKDLFIKVDVDKSKVRIGEQVTASYKLYARLPMQVGINKLPALNGFWTQDFDIPKQPKPEEEIIDGKKYQVFLLKKSALFPQQTGSLTLDPAEADGTARIVQQVKQRSPFADMLQNDPFFKQAFGGSLMMNDPFFNDDAFTGMAYKDVPVHLKSVPVHVTVTDLPAKGQPAGYGGAVGTFTATAKMDKTALTTDDVASLTLTIAGSGNLKLIQAPKLELPNGLDTYDPQIMDTITGRSTVISGSKIITYSVAPHMPGEYNIPAIPVTYFNPQSGSYVTLHTQPFRLAVKPGKHYHPTAVAQSLALSDIHGNVLQTPADFSPLSAKPLFFTAGYWSMYALPMLAFIGIAFWRRREDELNADVALMKNRRANKIALKRLATAKTLLQQEQQKPFYEEISKAIWLYLSDKLSIPLSALSRETAADALGRYNKVPQNLLQEIEQVIQDCEVSLYAPSGGSQQMRATYEAALSVISHLEDYLKK